MSLKVPRPSLYLNEGDGARSMVGLIALIIGFTHKEFCNFPDTCGIDDRSMVEFFRWVVKGLSVCAAK